MHAGALCNYMMGRGREALCRNIAEATVGKEFPSVSYVSPVPSTHLPSPSGQLVLYELRFESKDFQIPSNVSPVRPLSLLMPRRWMMR